MGFQLSQTNNAKNGRISPTGLLTDQQSAFVKYFSAGLSPRESASLAGYAQPDQAAWSLRQLPHVRHAISETQAQGIQMEGARIAWETMQRLMTNEDAPAQVQFQCARWTLEAAGQGLAARAQKAGLATPGGKSLTEMTSGELERYIAEGREALAQSQAVEVATEIMSQLPIEPTQG